MRRKTFYLSDSEITNFCGQKFISFEGGAYELPYSIKQADGEHNLETCEGCRTQQKHIINVILENSKDFPNCCEWHKNLLGLKEFKISDFIGLEESIANKVLFTYHHVINHIDNDDYFEDFTNYYEYVIQSFGSFPNMYGAPFQFSVFCGFLIDLVTKQRGNLNTDKISKKEIDNRLANIILHIEDSFKPVNQKANKNTDFNLLLSTYDKWYRTFPFELSYFKHLKEKFKKTIPLLKGKPKYNKYTGLSKFKLITKEELTQFLIGLTKDIISNINGLILYENGLLADVEKIKLELILRNRQLEINDLKSIDNSDRKGYIKYLKFWFKTEKKFIDEITPLLNESNNLNKNPDNSNIQRPNRTDLAYFIYYMESTNYKILKNIFPSTKAWDEFGKKYNKNPKNIQITYNDINKNKSNRLNKSKINNITYVIDNMLNDYEKAKNLAIDELKLAEMNL